MMTFDGVGWLQLPECFVSIQALINRDNWQNILVVVVTQRNNQRHRENGLLGRFTVKEYEYTRENIQPVANCSTGVKVVQPW